MILRLNGNSTIENLRNYPAELVEKLGALLAAGVQAHADPRRKNFYDVENGSRIFFIYVSPISGKVMLATWFEDSLAATAQENGRAQNRSYTLAPTASRHSGYSGL